METVKNTSELKDLVLDVLIQTVQPDNVRLVDHILELAMDTPVYSFGDSDWLINEWSWWRENDDGDTIETLLKMQYIFFLEFGDTNEITALISRMASGLAVNIKPRPNSFMEQGTSVVGVDGDFKDRLIEKEHIIAQLHSNPWAVFLACLSLAPLPELLRIFEIAPPKRPGNPPVKP